MKILLTRNRLPLSWAIRKVTGEPASHMSFVFDDALVFGMSIGGPSVSLFRTFLQKHTLVDILHFDLPLEKEEEVYQVFIKLIEGKRYDFGLLIYSGLSLLGHRLLGIEKPTRNKLDDPDRLVCFEPYRDLAEMLPDWLTPVEAESFAMQTPWGIRNLIKQNVSAQVVSG